MAAQRLPATIVFDAKPYQFEFPTETTALLLIDMQRDFLLPGGFGFVQGGDLSAVQASILKVKEVLSAFRSLHLPIFHTREGHLPNLSDCPSSKLARQVNAPGNEKDYKKIGDKADMGRLLVRGEYGHDLVDQLQPIPGEIVIDKPGKGAFWNTSLMEELLGWGITHLIIGGVTTECCVTTTAREANDRGFECCIIEESTAGYNPSFKSASLEMIYWAHGLFGFVAKQKAMMDALGPYKADLGTELPKTVQEYSDQSDLEGVKGHRDWDGSLEISHLSSAYRNGLSPITVLRDVYERIEAYKSHDAAVWIHLTPLKDAIERAEALVLQYPDPLARPILFGLPFSVKDSINVAGIPTTTACPPLTHTPATSATVFEKVMKLGGIFVGKTNLDQLATGLTGCRSPWGSCKSVLDPSRISGGSSSGSAVSVGAGLVSFSIATDTAGSGRVPAGFNGVVGFKPTKGTISFSGVTPACRSLDCISLMVLSVRDARVLWCLLRGHDVLDPFSKYTETPYPPRKPVHAIGKQRSVFRFGIPPQDVLTNSCSPEFKAMFDQFVAHLASIGGEIVPLNWTPFHEAGMLLYDGTFVNERLAGVPEGAAWFQQEKEAFHPVIREIFDEVLQRKQAGWEIYKDLERMRIFQSQIAMTCFSHTSEERIDILVVPTAPFHPTHEDVARDPIKVNRKLGTFTHFANVLDLTGLTLPVVPRSGFSVTLLAPHWGEPDVLRIANLVGPREH